MTDLRTELLLANLHRAFTGKSWHGPTLKGTLRGVTAKRAARRPGNGRNSIRDLVYHCAYWKYVVRRWLVELAGSKPGPDFPRTPANFPDPKEKLTDKAWEADKRLLNNEHAKLVAAVKAMPPGALDKKGGRTGMTYAELILGVAAHDLYHAGQVSLIKRL